MKVEYFKGDMPINFALDLARLWPLCIDTETTGLDWQRDKLCVVTVANKDCCAVVQLNDTSPEHLHALLMQSNAMKLFHNACFDLRFLRQRLGGRITNVRCTKILAKLDTVKHPSTSLAPLVKQYLGVELPKAQQQSDWTKELTQEQIEYCVNDVRHLPTLYDDMFNSLSSYDGYLYHRCCEHIPTRVELEVRGYGDVFAY